MGYLIAALIIVSLILVIAGIFWFVRRTRRVYRSRSFRMDDQASWREKWHELEAMMGDKPAHWPTAIIEADKLLDSVLKSMHLPGQDMGERFRFLMRDEPKLRYARTARFIRNRIVHESSFVLDESLAKEAMSIYKKVLKDLGILL